MDNDSFDRKAVLTILQTFDFMKIFSIGQFLLVVQMYEHGYVVEDTRSTSSFTNGHMSGSGGKGVLRNSPNFCNIQVLGSRVP